METIRSALMRGPYLYFISGKSYNTKSTVAVSFKVIGNRSFSIEMNNEETIV
jgi:hypothetical protein